MELDLGPRAEALRRELRPWLEAHRIEALAPMAGADVNPTQHVGTTRELLDEWAQCLLDQQLVCAGWPEEFGGRGLGPLETAAFYEELRRVGMPRIVRGMGERLVGPSIIAHGTAEQQARFLPRIVSGDDHYCQGFSEPDAGSDLAAVKTRGVVDGTELVITGQKVWTSWHREATFVFTLCRTDTEAPKHRGITYVLVPKDQPGVEIRPLKQLTGGEEFAETFFDGARAPLSNVIGGIDGGWRVAMTTLGSERAGNLTTHHVEYENELAALVDVARANGRASDPVVRQRLAAAFTDVQLMRFAGLRATAELVAGREPGPGSAIAKLVWSEYHRRLGELAMAVQGATATIRPDTQPDEPVGIWEGESYRLDRWQQAFFASRAGTIYAGTSEIQRNIIAERVLGLPREPRT